MCGTSTGKKYICHIFARGSSAGLSCHVFMWVFCQHPCLVLVIRHNMLTPARTIAAESWTPSAVSQHMWFEGRVPAPSTNNRWRRRRHAETSQKPCFVCHKTAFGRRHGFYVDMCASCGTACFARLTRTQTPPQPLLLVGYHALVVMHTAHSACVGYQVALRLLRSGARVTCAMTTLPQPHWFDAEPDRTSWQERLVVTALDLDARAAHIEAEVLRLVDTTLHGSLDGAFVVPQLREDDDDKKVALIPAHVEHVLRVNTTSTFMVCQVASTYLAKSVHPRRCLVNAHARDGMFSRCRQRRGTTQTAMTMPLAVAKAASHMVTHMVQKTYGDRFPCYGVACGAARFTLDDAAHMTDPVLSVTCPPARRGTIHACAYFEPPQY